MPTRKSREAQCAVELIHRRRELQTLLSEKQYELWMEYSKSRIQSDRERHPELGLLEIALNLSKEVLIKNEEKTPTRAKIESNALLVAALEWIEEES
jgi:hypothetical protein